MTDTRLCNQPRGKTLVCYKPATLKGGYWECPGGHIVSDSGPPPDDKVGLTVARVRSTMEDQLPPPSLLPAPPTGPTAEPYAQEEGLPPAYVEFMATYDGCVFFEALCVDAMAKVVLGVPRYSVRGFVYEWRKERGGRVNNTWTPWIADALILQHPELEAIVERRVRKKSGPSSYSLPEAV